MVFIGVLGDYIRHERLGNASARRAVEWVNWGEERKGSEHSRRGWSEREGDVAWRGFIWRR
jgi:hypothetical protein